MCTKKAVGQYYPVFLLASHTRILSISILIGGSPIIGSFPQLSDVDVAFMSGDLYNHNN